jgi:YfiH family protein
MTLDLLRAKQLDVPHGFSTRSGGVSAAPFDSLNLGAHVNDEPALVLENRRRLLRSSGARSLAVLDQVHGDQVLTLNEGRDDLVACGTADASITQTRGLALCIGTADCLPILLHAPEVRAVGAAHAGWRGTDKRIGARTVESLAVLGASPKKMRAVLGPCIRRCCYEVSHELAAQFETQFGASVVARSFAQPHVDLVEASRLTLIQAGLPPESIEVIDACTSCDATRFFSHRRDQGKTGRMLAFVCLA